MKGVNKNALSAAEEIIEYMESVVSKRAKKHVIANIILNHMVLIKPNTNTQGE